VFDRILARIGTSLDRAEIPYMIIGARPSCCMEKPRLTRYINITLGVISIG